MNLVIRADANSQLGAGHLMRCLALAQELKRAGTRVVFVLASGSPMLTARLRSEDFETVMLDVPSGSLDDGAETAGVAVDIGAAWLILDGYQFDAPYQRAVKDRGLKLLCIDDYGHAQRYWADIVLNQNIGAGPTLYPDVEPYTQILLGTEFVLLRKEFEKWRGWKREIRGQARRVLITLGGGDTVEISACVRRAIRSIAADSVEVVMVTGMTETPDQPPDALIQMKAAVDDMAELMSWAEVAICAGGSTCWEASFMGLPAIILVLGKDQEPIAQGLAQANAGINLGWWRPPASEMALANSLGDLLEDAGHRRSMSEAGRRLVDGGGANRVAKLLMTQENKKARTICI